MLNYNKLFENGNIVGRKNLQKSWSLSKTIVDIIGKTKNDWSEYFNENLSCNEFEIQYIIRLDSEGNIYEKLFDRHENKTIYNFPNPMPPIWRYSFVRLFDSLSGKTILAMADPTRGMLHYKNETLDGEKYSCLEDEEIIITEIYPESVECFSECDEIEPIWRNPAWLKYRDYYERHKED